MKNISRTIAVKYITAVLPRSLFMVYKPLSVFYAANMVNRWPSLSISEIPTWMVFVTEIPPTLPTLYAEVPEKLSEKYLQIIKRKE